MRCIKYGPLLITAAQAVLAAELSRPRGVSPERMANLPIDISGANFSVPPFRC